MAALRRLVWLALAGAVIAVAAVIATRGDAPRSAACERRSFEGSAFTVCTFDARRAELRLAWQDEHGAPLGGFDALSRALGADARRVAFAMNAGMFDAHAAPLGLLIVDGVALHAIDPRDGDGNFYLKPNGVLSVDRDGGVRVEPTAAYAARAGAAPVWATQSGPMLVIDGALHPAFQADGASRKIRNGVGARDAHTAVFAISDEPVSFGRFARLFRDALGCRDALFLDGVVSSAWIPATGRRDAAHALGPLVVVLDP